MRMSRRIVVASEGLHLSAQQRAILQLVAEGRSDREIAATLCVARCTVRTHLTRIYRINRLCNRTAAAASYVRAQI